MLKNLLITVVAVMTCITFTSSVRAEDEKSDKPQKRPQRTEEQRKVLKELREKYDKNKDNKLDKAEFVSSLPERAQAMADQMWSSRVDQDGDGFVTREQFLALRMGPAGGGGGK